MEHRLAESPETMGTILESRVAVICIAFVAVAVRHGDTWVPGKELILEAKW